MFNFGIFRVLGVDCSPGVEFSLSDKSGEELRLVPCWMGAFGLSIVFVCGFEPFPVRNGFKILITASLDTVRGPLGRYTASTNR